MFVDADVVTAVASVYQMLRGSVIIFTGILSVLFLKRRLNINNYTGMGITAAGIVLVGLSVCCPSPLAPARTSCCWVMRWLSQGMHSLCSFAMMLFR